jgi:alpha-L-arabinofuranosidase
MKKNILICAFCIINYSLIAQRALIKIDIDRTLGEVDKNIYGNFVEHLGRVVYGGIYEMGSPLSDENGFRIDVMAAVKELNVTLLRYPGGNFVSNYNWIDGVGPQRIPRSNLAWGGVETNEFGTNEFMKFVKMAGSEPFIAVNLGTGTIEEARRWVEYCNVEEGPYYAELRKEHGYPEPHNVIYWSLGNEMDGHWQMGQLSAEDYAKKAREAAKLMRLTDPSIKLIAAGSSNYSRDANPDHWNRTVINELRNYVDYIALHLYVGNRDNDYYTFVSTPHIMQHRTKIARGMINEAMQAANRGTRDPIRIAWDEYNVWYRARGTEPPGSKGKLEEIYNLEDALVIAGFLNVFIRNADVVKMANLAQLVNGIAPIYTSENGMFRQTIYFPVQLFANHANGTALDLYVDSDTYTVEPKSDGNHERLLRGLEMPYLDVSATYTPDNKLVLMVVNRHKENAILTDIICQEGSFTGQFEVHEITGPDIKSINGFDRENVKTTTKRSIRPGADKMTYSFPPHSITMIKGNIKR